MTPTSASPLERLLSSLATSLSPEAASQLVDFTIDLTTDTRIRELAEKCNEGQLTTDEHDEYEEFVDGIDLIAILQIMARRRIPAEQS